MRMYLLSDNNDTLTGMRLSGVEGVVLHDEESVRQKIDELLKEEDIAVVMITSTLMNFVRETVYELKLKCRQPLFIEIPDRHGNGQTKDSISKYVKDAIGVDMS